MLPSPAPSPAINHRPWNPFVVPLVGVACIVFLVLTYYKILRRHCCAFDGLTFSRTRNQRQLLSEENPEHDISLQFQSRGLDSFIMHSLPITQFKKKNEEELGQISTDCAVCLGEFEEGEWVKHLPNCSHAFHAACIDTWFQTHSSCPLCRSYVYDLAMHHEYTISMYTLLETLRREDFIQDRSAHYQALRSHILENSSLRIDLQNAS